MTHWSELNREPSARAFAIAAAAPTGALETLRCEVDRAIANGLSLREVRRRLAIVGGRIAS
ncbi:hypothetical protein ACFPOB_30385 [Bosea eneae]|uniref:Uncharacterized protein n=1 Tax=Bosea eneae TaxID=151454 RepID=A0ABW0J1J6_9HYPH